VCHCEYISPLSASRWSVGISIRPPNGDHQDAVDAVVSPVR
jgi:hypothetical protein